MPPHESSEHGRLSLFSSTTIPDLTNKIIRPDDQYCEAGGFGDVFRCRYTSDDGVKEVAVKAFRFSFTLDEPKRDEGKVARMIRRELGIWKRLGHRNIVPFIGIVYGFGRRGSASLVSLWMPHGTLHAFLEAHDNRLVVAHRLQLLLDIANGLQYLHSFPLIHGDLSSNNVLLDHNYNACLSDFGCASLLGELPEGFAYLKMSTVRPGTLRWAAPEHFSLNEEETKASIKSDIYSFGNMALLVLSGEYPWSEVRVDAAVMLRLSQGLKPGRPLARPIDDRHWELIERCWSSIPERPVANDVVASLQQLLEAHPPPPILRDILDPPSSSSSIQTAKSENQKSATNELGENAPKVHRLLAKLKLGGNWSNTVVARGLPTYLKEEQVQEFFQRLGELKRFHLVQEDSDGPSKGIAVFEYVDASVTDVAIRSLNGMEIGDQHIVVQREDSSSPDADETHGEQDVEDSASQEKSSTAKRAENSPSDTPQSAFKWVRGELLGKGTYGHVYLGMNTSTGEVIAVKQVEKHHKEGRRLNFVPELKREREILCELDHPHIVAYLGSEETATHLSMFMEYVSGGSIASYLREHGRFNEEVIKSFTAQIFDGLAYLHAKHIIHRNMEPNNILVEGSGTCKITGFGNAQRVDDDRALWIPRRGIVYWTAPEMARSQGGKRYGPKVDVWSAGCVVLRMWAGGRPWRDGGAFPLMIKATRQGTSPPLPLDVILSDLAVDFRNRCLAIDPETRASAADLVRHPYLTLPPGWVFTELN